MTKLAAAIKGGGVRAGHVSAAVLAEHFVLVANATGLAAALRWLITGLRASTGVVGLLAVLEGLLDAVETGEPHAVILSSAAAVAAAMS
ncbi:hypothetical protein [Actinokineospora sp. NBRC 105648]|uniref:hypothetical protein n=1 Tax=Actinokineospora sp. NBRC 105648 TaxID=3032206 RepID=UPI0024A26F6A|nr:hypothetical protein [Actinokineospora sp. NBRC 105648]GLZ36575.1 hypothetical protein Acsp05_02000 [Actinokineospora sp. NBRC 105648]